MTDGPYATGAPIYWRNGFGNPVPVGMGGEDEGWAWFPRRKTRPASGYTGEKNADVAVSWPDLNAWIEQLGHVNVALKLQHGLVGIDVDDYGDKSGAATIEAAEDELGPLPSTIVSTSRGPGQGAGIRLYKVPVTARFSGAQRRLRERFGRHVDVLHAGHRYAVVWPSEHPEGGTYAWYRDGIELSEVPGLADVTELPGAWLAFLADPVDSRPAASASAQDRTPGGSGFILPSETSRSERREFTRAQAEAFCSDAVMALRSAVHGDINDALNTAAAKMSHFVPAFWPEADVTGWLLGWQREAWVNAGRKDDGDYSAAKATIASGLAQTSDPWKAVLVPDAPGVFADPAPVPAGDELDAAVAAMLGQMLDVDGLASLPTPEPVVKGLFYRGTLASITGAYGSLKTFVALDVALCVASGTAWHGHEVSAGKVWYLLAEGVSGLRRRVDAWRDEWARHHEGQQVGLEWFRVMPKAVQVKETAWDVLVEAARRERPALIVVDTKARHTAGYEENSASDTAMVVARVDALKEASGATVLVVHHTGWGGDRMRGSSAWGGALDTDVLVEKTGSDREPRAAVKVVKQKDAEPLAPFELAARVVLLGMDADGDEVTSLAFDQDPFADNDRYTVSAADQIAGALDIKEEKHPEVLADLVAVLENIAPSGAAFGASQADAKRVMVAGAGKDIHPAVRRRVRSGALAGLRGYHEVEVRQAFQYAAAYGWLEIAESPTKFTIRDESSREASLAKWREDREAERAQEVDKTD